MLRHGGLTFGDEDVLLAVFHRTTKNLLIQRKPIKPIPPGRPLHHLTLILVPLPILSHREALGAGDATWAVSLEGGLQFAHLRVEGGIF